MKTVKFEIDEEQTDRLVLESLQDMHSNMKQDLYQRLNNENSFGVFVSDKKDDIRKMKKHLKALNRIIKYMTPSI
jgi:hypothetical protein